VPAKRIALHFVCGSRGSRGLTQPHEARARSVPPRIVREKWPITRQGPSLVRRAVDGSARALVLSQRRDCEPRLQCHDRSENLYGLRYRGSRDRHATHADQPPARLEAPARMRPRRPVGAALALRLVLDSTQGAGEGLSVSAQRPQRLPKRRNIRWSRPGQERIGEEYSERLEHEAALQLRISVPAIEWALHIIGDS
jgi:hypothetical protein